MDRPTFFRIMGTVPAGVTVVTTLDGEGRARGLTVAAVCSVSAEPPTLLVSIDRRSRSLVVLRERGRFAVNFLRGDRADVGMRFASRVPDRFDGIEWRPGVLGVPVLHADSLAWAECRVEQEFVSGDHVVVIGAVEAGVPPPPHSRPLMYFRHRFSAWSGGVDDPRATDDTRSREQAQPEGPVRPDGEKGMPRAGEPAVAEAPA
jgi:flavin reductase (DIM6/NTAB) family NADH-FMN oxidoreductase RutF